MTIENRDTTPANMASDATAPTASLSMKGHIGLITMCDPARHNALASGHVRALLAAIAESKRRQARALVITSSVKNFCAGADIAELLAGKLLEPGPKDDNADTPVKLFKTLLDDPRPVICAIDGLALGGGVELALSSDLVFASDNARFAMPELGLGVLPRTALVRLPEIVGRRKAMELILTRRKFTAHEAVAMGLVNRLVDSDDLVQAALDTAAEIITAPPAAIAAVKRRLGRVTPGVWQEFDSLLGEMDPGEWREGLGAFADKRAADFDRFWSRIFPESAA
jgi:enoyl-CoA hydratase/carnithine racemase